MDTFKYGRRSPKRAPALQLTNYLAGGVPAHPDAVNYLAALSDWQMLGNDTYGDCVAVTWANTRRLVTAALATESYPEMAEVIEIYKTQNPTFPAEDNGMDIQTLLEHLTKNAGPDGTKALAFAQVNPASPDEVKAAIAIFGSVWTGLNVLNANMDEFNAGLPWDYLPASGVDGGHSVITGGYGSPGAGPLGGDERFITWAEETSFTDAFWTHQVEEAWVVIWPEHLGSKAFQEGVDLTALAADYQALTGRPFPVQPSPTPEPPPPVPPVPAPPPGPVVDAADIALRNAFVSFHEAFHAWRQAKGI